MGSGTPSHGVGDCLDGVWDPMKCGRRLPFFEVAMFVMLAPFVAFRAHTQRSRDPRVTAQGHYSDSE